jgi:hypothetical protein
LNAALVENLPRAELAELGWRLETSLNELRTTARSSLLGPFAPRTHLLELVDAAASVVLAARSAVFEPGATNQRDALDRLDRAVLNLELATRVWAAG